MVHFQAVNPTDDDVTLTKLVYSSVPQFVSAGKVIMLSVRTVCVAPPDANHCKLLSRTSFRSLGFY